ncbi:hypothetical protein SO802_004972 [Lithocarpus litseifolius]|uniref:Endonuclease/exonuclease/phosphatase domain-containing protein n=1 Tax=Lithocarpus litseifolius TaxID=425828 RepID=A0AAW2DJZ5_9ROSI
MKGLQGKLNLSQGIIVPCDGRSGGLALLWKEGTNVEFKSCSHSHIDVVVHEGEGRKPWRATGFYGYPDTGMRHTSWKLLEALRNQCDLPWIVFGDFNEITHADKKIGWLEWDFRQMEGFRDCLYECGLIDLGFMGPRFTRCNGRGGEQRTLVRLDRMVANEEWLEIYPEAKVYHRSMSTSDHCLLALWLQKRKPSRPIKKRFFFEAMWTRDERCREVIEAAWDPLNGNPEELFQDRLKHCQVQLLNWNRRVFGNVNRELKLKQRRLQQLENLNQFHETAEEIKAVKKEINENLLREEIMWNQRSRALWIKSGDRNTKFFHATANQRRRKNRIEGLKDADGRWKDEPEDVEKIALTYFSTIFSTDHPADFEASLSAVNRRVSNEMNDILLREFKEDEVWSALKQMHPHKIPRSGQYVSHLLS